MLKIAILNVADSGPLDSLALMLRSAGYDCRLPDADLKRRLRRAGCVGVQDVSDLVGCWGYEPPLLTAEAGARDLARPGTLLVDTKAHANYAALQRNWPGLRVLWHCLNGGDPAKRTDGLPWANPPCPVLTPNQWYASLTQTCHHCLGREPGTRDAWKMSHPCRLCNGERAVPTPWVGKAYVYYPPFVPTSHYRRSGIDGPPVCLVHNVARWGYGACVEPLRAIGVRFYGGGDGNDALLSHKSVPHVLSRAVALVHVKKGDCMGYAVMEAMHAGCPVIVTQQYIDEVACGRLLEPGVTCATFDPEPRECAASVEGALQLLRDPEMNARVGRAARARLDELAWRESRDGESLRAFLRRHFP